MELYKDKLPIIYESMKENDFDMWMIIGRETIMKSEPALEVIGDIEFIIASALIFTRNKLYALVSPLDKEAYKDVLGIDEIIVYDNSIEDGLKDILNKLKPKTLALNYSKDASCDGLTFSMYQMILDIINDLDFEIELTSSAKLLSKIRGMKNKTQIEKIRDCVIKADEYLRMVPSICKEGTTSLDIFNFLHEVAYKDGYKMSWAPSECPSVGVDPAVKSGHMGIIETPIVKGYLINIDYGVAKDGYCSDIQRMYYVLKDDEDDAPQDIKEAFYLIRDAIRASKEFMKPGVTGFEVDQIARHMIVDMGYDSWNAALGHQVGHKTHDGGTILANRRPRYNHKELIDTKLEVGNVFTLEPSLEVKAGRICLEEDVVITKDACEWLIKPQDELILIRI